MKSDRNQFTPVVLLVVVVLFFFSADVFFVFVFFTSIFRECENQETFPLHLTAENLCAFAGSTRRQPDQCAAGD